MKHIISEAIAFAVLKHQGQFDKAGLPYILHPLKVMHYLKTDDEELMAIAVLHDVVEDTGATYEELRRIGMTVRVIEGVKCLTKVPGETYKEYIERVCLNHDAIRVKKADVRHNMDIRRLKGVTEKDFKRIEKYAKTYQILLEKELSF